MDWKTLYLDPKGRIGQKDFWLGILIIIGVAIVIGLVLHFALARLPIIGQIFSLVLLVPYYCLATKRLHDFGKPDLFAQIVIALNAITTIIGIVMTGAITAATVAASTTGVVGAGMGTAMLVGTLSLITGLVTLAFVLWAGLTKGDPAPNAYGPPRAIPLVG